MNFLDIFGFSADEQMEMEAKWERKLQRALLQRFDYEAKYCTLAKRILGGDDYDAVQEEIRVLDEQFDLAGGGE